MSVVILTLSCTTTEWKAKIAGLDEDLRAELLDDCDQDKCKVTEKNSNLMFTGRRRGVEIGPLATFPMEHVTSMLNKLVKQGFKIVGQSSLANEKGDTVLWTLNK